MKNSAFISSKPETNATKEEARSALVPRLRFPEFRDTEAWEQKEVGDLFQVTRGDVLSMKLVHDEKTEAMPYPVYSSQTKNNGLSGFYSKYLFEGAITWTTDGANAGDVNYRPGKFYCTNVCGVLLSSKGFANPCIAALINSVARKYVSYVGNPKLMNGVMGKIPIPLPPIREQQKIAECLSSVDELIAAQARKVDALKTHKNGLMQQIFPREGETQPRLRFPEFQNAGEWEETPLSKLGNLISGLTYSPKDIRESGLLVLRSSNVQNGEIALDDNVYVNPEVKGVNPSQPNDILICVRNGSKSLIGKCALIPEGLPMCTHGAFMAVFRAQKPSFTFQLFQTARYQKQVAADLGATINSINGKQFLKYTFFVPKQAEQVRIASCLRSLDFLITAETQKLAALKTHKKGLMQQLFPSPGLDEP